MMSITIAILWLVTLAVAIAALVLATKNRSKIGHYYACCKKSWGKVAKANSSMIPYASSGMFTLTSGSARVLAFTDAGFGSVNPTSTGDFQNAMASLSWAATNHGTVDRLHAVLSGVQVSLLSPTGPPAPFELRVWKSERCGEPFFPTCLRVSGEATVLAPAVDTVCLRDTCHEVCISPNDRIALVVRNLADNAVIVIGSPDITISTNRASGAVAGLRYLMESD